MPRGVKAESIRCKRGVAPLPIRRQALLAILAARRLDDEVYDPPHAYRDKNNASYYGTERRVACGGAVWEEVVFSSAVVGDEDVAGEESCRAGEYERKGTRRDKRTGEHHDGEKSQIYDREFNERDRVSSLCAVKREAEDVEVGGVGLRKDGVVEVERLLHGNDMICEQQRGQRRCPKEEATTGSAPKRSPM